MKNANHYQILEVNVSASQGQIKQAYRRLAKRFHPDCGEAANHEQIILINAAYEVLGDPEKRRSYDQQLSPNYPSRQRQERTAKAQNYYKRRRETEQKTEIIFDVWLKEIYTPIHHLVNVVINSLDGQIDDLSADPFDDELMSIFQEYLEDCRESLQQAKQIFGSQPNPSQAAKIAASLYFCLNQLSDGIDELEWFALNYDDSHLHTGKELFRIAKNLCYEASEMIDLRGN
ncbi:heat shock protein DnaJ domain protein [Rippkaea orientalis PCC 8801]|uniref:Heat shock protein DnaJ domain protein n=1 Tax=Rippkaea orientalis (strain PCC 8801 / RF-1) TaxID=41431 RepID=B7JUF1_RIPO1|nr:DnaJ domain-containing protein [Rippkaea orientalis]ACK64531.1 heat shock protein DnaJ domain protein [Rippkaea orientalis PCC 8801]